jgi:hypothetical protein
MTNHLLLQMHMNIDNQGSLVLKRSGMSARINDLLAPLTFVANMKQLSLAVDTGARQNCAYEIKNTKGLEWVLACRFAKGIVALELWFQKFGFNEHLETLFSWEGTAKEFGKSVNKLVERLPVYRFNWF